LSGKRKASVEDQLPPLPAHVTVSEPKPPGKPLLRDDVYEALRSLDDPGGVRVAEIVRHCYAPEDITDNYQKRHQKVDDRLRQLEGDHKAHRVGFTSSSGFSRPAGLWRVKEDA
jgi:hypothetical protein